MLLYPAQGCLNAGPEFGQGLTIASALEVHPRQHHEERGCIHRAVVSTKWYLPEVRHLTMAPLMQNFAGLSVRLRIELCGLRRRKCSQHSSRDRGIGP